MKIYDTKKYKIGSNILFDCPINDYFDLDKNWVLVENSETITLKKKYRIDYIADLYDDMDYVRVISLINGKMKGVFSYESNDEIEIPNQSDVDMFAIEASKSIDDDAKDISENFVEELVCKKDRDYILEKINDYRENRLKTISMSEEIEMIGDLMD